MQDKAKKWDKKSKNYPRYNPNKEKFEAKAIQKIKENHVSFQGKNILDVGAGTGVYTLRLALEAKSVVAMDFSADMLMVLEEDAKNIGLENISTCKSSWQEYESEKNFDIAFSTMSPALQEDADFIKFHNIATKKIYLGWAGMRDSDILNALFQAHNMTNTPPNGALTLKSWLIKNNINFTCEEFEELKISTCKCDEALQKYMWHLEIRDIKADETIVKDCLKKFCIDGIVTEKTQNRMSLLLW